MGLWFSACCLRRIIVGYKTYLSSFFFKHLQLQIARTTVDERACDTSPLTHEGTCCHPTIPTILKGNLIVAISLSAIMAVAVPFLCCHRSVCHGFLVFMAQSAGLSFLVLVLVLT